MCAHLAFFFFFNDTATTEIYTLSLHDALPILLVVPRVLPLLVARRVPGGRAARGGSVEIDADLGDGHGRPLTGSEVDRKSTRLNSSHTVISYAVFCLKKKKNKRVDRRYASAIS